MDSARMRLGGVLFSEAVEEKYLELMGRAEIDLAKATPLIRGVGGDKGPERSCRRAPTVCSDGAGIGVEGNANLYQGCSPPATTHSAIVEREEAKE